jgi:hypothetical protein
LAHENETASLVDAGRLRSDVKVAGGIVGHFDKWPVFSIFSGVGLYLNNGAEKLTAGALSGTMSIGDCFIPTSPVVLSPQVAYDGVTVPQ